MENNNNYFGIVRWCEEDVANAIKEQGFEPTEENVKIVMGTLNESAFISFMVQAGWDYLYNIVNQELEV